LWTKFFVPEVAMKIGGCWTDSSVKAERKYLRPRIWYKTGRSGERGRKRVVPHERVPLNFDPIPENEIARMLVCLDDIVSSIVHADNGIM
jgi:hypothetical protein